MSDMMSPGMKKKITQNLEANSKFSATRRNFIREYPKLLRVTIQNSVAWDMRQVCRSP